MSPKATKGSKSKSSLAGASSDLLSIPKDGFVVAIDGPAGTGKSSVTRRLALLLGFTHIDTGALYRSIALLVKQSGDETQGHAVSVAENAKLSFKRNPRKNPSQRVWINGKDVTDQIRTPEISLTASRISAIPKVRKALLQQQRRMGCEGNTILEGRDIGTVIFPDADLKFFLTASVDERAKRRVAELEAQGGDPVSFADVKEQIAARDYADMTREVAPLKRAADAVEVDTSHLTLDEVVAMMEAIICKRAQIKPKRQKRRAHSTP
jgi:cytidylate kinase